MSTPKSAHASGTGPRDEPSEEEAQRRMVAGCLRGDGPSVRGLYDRVRAALAVLLRKGLLPARLQAELPDLLQEVVTRALLALAHFRFQSSLDTWLYPVVENAVLDYLRKYTTRVRSLDALRQQEALVARPVAEEAYDCDRAMDRLADRLPSEYLAVFALYMSGLRIRQIAEQAELPESTVTSRLAHMREICGQDPLFAAALAQRKRRRKKRSGQAGEGP